MGWCLHGIFMTFRTLSFISTHLFWILTLLSGCAYFRLWKSYDVFWLWVYLLTTCIVPRLRYDNLFLQCAFLWRKKCVDGQRYRYALKEQDRRIDEEDEKSAKITNAIDLAIALLRVRVSAAILIGNIHLLWTVSHADRPVLTMPQFMMMDFVIFQLSIWLDMWLFWNTLLIMACKQCQLCYQLGCCRYYLWCIFVIIIGILVMELPMLYAFRCLDDSWCILIIEPRNDYNMTTVG